MLGLSLKDGCDPNNVTVAAIHDDCVMYPWVLYDTFPQKVFKNAMRIIWSFDVTEITKSRLWICGHSGLWFLSSVLLFRWRKAGRQRSQRHVHVMITRSRASHANLSASTEIRVRPQRYD